MQHLSSWGNIIPSARAAAQYMSYCSLLLLLPSFIVLPQLLPIS